MAARVKSLIPSAVLVRSSHTVDGRNPAPLIVRFYTSQWCRIFFHLPSRSKLEDNLAMLFAMQDEHLEKSVRFARYIVEFTNPATMFDQQFACAEQAGS